MTTSLARMANIQHKGANKYAWTICPICGKEKLSFLLNGVARHPICRKCYHLQARAEKAPCWKGGRIKASNGYIQILVRPDDFFYPMANKSGYVAEHRLAMAQHLKRCLLLWEIAHHKNHKRDDNRLENLMLLPNRSVHFVDSQMKMQLKRLQGKILKLEERLLLLEAENILLREDKCLLH